MFVLLTIRAFLQAMVPPPQKKKNLVYLKLMRASTVKCVEKQTLSTFVNRLQPNPCTLTSTEKQSHLPLVIEYFVTSLKGNTASVVKKMYISFMTQDCAVSWMSGPFIFRRKTTGTSVHESYIQLGRVEGLVTGLGRWFGMGDGFWGGCWRSLCCGVYREVRTAYLWPPSISLSTFTNSAKLLMSPRPVGGFGAVPTLTSHEQSQPDNFCCLQGLTAHRGSKTHQRRCQTE